MKSNFWTSQNIIILAMGLLAIPVGAATGLHLMKITKSSTDQSRPPGFMIPTELEDNPEIVDFGFGTPLEKAIPVEDAERTIEGPETVIEKPDSHADDHRREHAEHKEVDAVVEINTREEPKVGAIRFREEDQVQRLIGRINQATEQSELHEHRDEIRSALENAEVVERIHNVTFNSANLHLDHRDETYLVSAMQNSPAMRKFRTNPNAKILVLGYASKDGDSSNLKFALNRAQSAEHTIHEHEKIFGFEGQTKSWCIGETDSLSLETDENCSQHNRAAEIWLVVSKDKVFEEIHSDKFLQTRIIKSKHSHSHH